MKKSLLALAVLGAYVGVASAQSSVTLYGTVDLSGKYVKNNDQKKRLSLSQDGINSSQLGFRGIEDLGGGLKAGFLLLSGVNADTGSANGKFWNRRSTVSLFSPLGELRLGRDYTPTFWNNTIFDAFGTNGLGDSSHVLQLATSTFVRADNAISYLTPATLGGFYGQAMVAASEGAVPVPGISATPTAPGNGSPAGSALSGTGNQGRYLGGRVGFAAGPFDIAVVAAQQRFQFAQGAPGFSDPGDHQNTYNVGGSWNFGFLKLLGYVARDKTDDRKELRGSVSGVVTLGQGEIHLGYDRSKLDRDGLSNNTIWQGKGTYVYNLSKRTAMYGTVAYLHNGDISQNSITSGTAQVASPAAGNNSKGFELGVRHFF